MRTTYAYHARVLKLLQSHRPPNRWLVKAPWHNFHLDDLIGVYPNATLVMCHRDPAKLIPSVVSLLLITRSMVVPKDEIDPTELGQFVLEHLRVSIERVMDFRRRHGDDRFIDVFHEPFNADPERTAERVYARLGVELKPPVREAMAGWAERNRKGAYGEHRYAAEEFGLSEAAIRDTFADYMRHFDITPAASAA